MDNRGFLRLSFFQKKKQKNKKTKLKYQNGEKNIKMGSHGGGRRGNQVMRCKQRCGCEWGRLYSY